MKMTPELVKLLNRSKPDVTLTIIFGPGHNVRCLHNYPSYSTYSSLCSPKCSDVQTLTFPDGTEFQFTSDPQSLNDCFVEEDQTYERLGSVFQKINMQQVD